MSATAHDLIHDLANQGIQLSRRGDRLRVETAIGTLSDDLLEHLAAHKPELLARVRLRELADAEGFPTSLVDALTVADLEGCDGLTDDTLRAYLRCLRDSDLREHGKVPPDETATAICRSCGPVWVAPEVAAVAPKIGGFARLLGCPWCHINRTIIPRPKVKCSECRRFVADTVNPAAGIGTCLADHKPSPNEPMCYPHAERECASFIPR